MTDSYRTIRFTRSVLGEVIEDQLSEIRTLPALVELEIGVGERLIDGELQAHRLFDLVAETVRRTVLHPVERVELVDHLGALLVDPDTDVVAGLVGHTRAHTPAVGKAADMEGHA